jgi:hypothetical protein
MSGKWTKEEDQIIRDTWASNNLMKYCLPLIPNRTERAIMVRVQALKLGARPHLNRGPRSNILAIVLREMAQGYVFSSRQIADRFKCTVKHGSTLLRHAYTAKTIHIQSWRRTHPGGPYIAVYGIGNHEDAIIPGPKTKKEYNRTRYVNKRMKEGKMIGNVFGVAMAQVMDAEPPKLSKGRYESRVYQQSMALRDFEEAAA